MMLKCFRVLVAGFALTLLPTSGMSQERPSKGSPEKVRDGVVGRILHLMPPAFTADLRLTEEQRDQIQKLEQEFNSKRLGSLMKTVSRVMAIVDSMDAGEGDKEVAPVLALCHEITGGLLESRRSHMLYEKKMMTLLNADQQAKFTALKEHGPRLLAERQGVTRSLHFYPSQEGLQLTDQQKQKVGELQREMETRFRELLTEEQRRHFDENRTPRKNAPMPKAPPSKEAPDR
jgi:Spy/CpxP family protein refolding chaperone